MRDRGVIYRKQSSCYYLNFDQIEGFEDFGKVIFVKQMPKLEEILV